MTSSMTAFARQEQTTNWGTLVWEIRSVNHRYLEMQFRLPENLRDLEPLLRDRLRKTLGRGKVETGLFFRPDSGASSELKINKPLLAQLQDALEQVHQQISQVDRASALDLLKWPGILEAAEVEYDEVKAAAKTAFDQALKQLVAMREGEGHSLVNFIEQRLDKIQEIGAQLRADMPDLMAKQKARVQSRIDEVKLEVEPGRLEQEVALLLQKSDVDEELDRLQTHLQEVRTTLGKKGAIGRRLDFLMQELNREANTLSSKAVNTDITQAAVELKVLIEQMREQIQNIE